MIVMQFITGLTTACIFTVRGIMSLKGPNALTRICIDDRNTSYRPQQKQICHCSRCLQFSEMFISCCGSSSSAASCQRCRIRMVFCHLRNRPVTRITTNMDCADQKSKAKRSRIETDPWYDARIGALYFKLIILRLAYRPNSNFLVS